MKKRLLYLVVAFAACLYTNVYAQRPGGMGGRGGQNMNAGHLYGKIVDSKTNKGIEGATVQIIASKFDTVTHKPKEVIAGTVLTQSNGDFSLESLPVFGKLKLRATALGYTDYNNPVSFDIKRPAGDGSSTGGGDASGSGSDRMQQMLSMVDKDLGNIKLDASEANLGNVTVTASAKQFFEMGVDRKIFNVDKNLVSSGQTATEVMKQIPSISVDIDGNVTLRNSSPQLFVDGRPTTLTMDQIPSDIIDKVELITNPSAKYDASSGGGGIINIVLKKNKKTGYNGGIRAGVDSRGKFNGGGDLNYRQGKINFTLNGMYNQRKSKSTSYTDRTNISDDPTMIVQEINGVQNNRFMFIRPGVDFFIDNRNTLTVNANFVNGKSDNDQPQQLDSLKSGVKFSHNDVVSKTYTTFSNPGGQVSFKHNFAKSGHNLSADVNYSSGTSTNSATLNTYTTNPLYPGANPVLQSTSSKGSNKFWTIQSDYENPLSETSKLEAGVRAAIRDYNNDNDQYLYNFTTNKYVLNAAASSHYKYKDQVYAAYATYSFKTGAKWNYQLGLRVESSNYKGTLLDSNTNFSVNFPLSLFPTAFVTYKMTDKQDLQFNYTRKVNRPGFFQLTPVVDYSDPQNLSVGNPALKPEFTNSLEVNYNNAYKKNANFLVSGYFRYATNLITSYQYKDINPQTSDSAVYNTSVNANNSITYGLELTNRNTIAKIWDLSVNLNLYNSKINYDNLKTTTTSSNQRVSWFAKVNNNFKLPKSFSVQFSGDYQAKTVLPPNSGNNNRRFGGGMMGNNQSTGTAQGYIKPRYSFDLAIRKDWTWKGGNSASVTLSMNDIFRTQLYSTYSESTFMIQNTQRRRDPQILRLNLSYRFGKFDATLFKRKNNKADQGGGTDMMNGGS